MPRIPGISHRRAVRALKKVGFKVVAPLVLNYWIHTLALATDASRR